jgi:hypothetical protein
MVSSIFRKRNDQRWRLVLFGCLLCLLLHGCTVKLLYNQLDWLIPWYLDDYIAFTDQQQAFVEQKVAAQLHWHRTTQLPHYASGLRRLRADLQDGLSRSELELYQARLWNYWQHLAHRLIPEASAVLATASNGQVDDLLVYLEAKNQQYYEDYVAVPADEARAKRLQRVQKSFERWLGKLHPVQEQILIDWSQRLRPNHDEHLRFRRQWQANFRDVLAQRHDSTRFTPAFLELVLSPEQSQTPSYRQVFEHNAGLVKQMILDIARHMTAPQRTHLSAALASLAEDLEQLAKAIP